MHKLWKKVEESYFKKNLKTTILFQTLFFPVFNHLCISELRRQSADVLEPLTNVVHRKSVTEEFLQVASAAINRLKKFTDDVMEDKSDVSESSEDMSVGIELQCTNIKVPRNSLISDASTEKSDSTLEE